MGKLILKGLPVDASKSIEEKWKLKTGDVFDEGYFREFAKTALGEILKPIYFERRAQSKAPPNIKTGTSPNRATLTVDVSIELTN
jgi:hypothetical protein